MTPRVEQLTLPPEYGKPSRALEWEAVRRRLEEAAHYWLSTVRSDGRPHVVPLDGLWLDDRWYFGGSEAAVRHRNLLANPQATLHLEDAQSAVIVDGRCEFGPTSKETADGLVIASKAKYGFAPPASAYRAGVWTFHASRAVAWTEYPADATRYVFA